MFAETINYLSDVIRPGKLEIAESATDTVRQLHDSTTQTDIQWLLGL